MLKRLTAFILLVFTLSHCTEGNYKKPDDPLEAGSDFIRFALDGNMNNARLFILKDREDEMLFSEWEKKNENRTKQEKAEYKSASIRINKSQNLNDSTTIISYSNSYKKEDHDLKLIKQDGEWWVDFKYTLLSNPGNPAVE